MASSALAPVSAASTPGFWDSTVGLKLAMAVTGLVLFGFVLGHMAGNLQLYLGRTALNEYGHFLHTALHGGGIWLARGVLLLSALIHIRAALVLSMRSNAARPIPYAQFTPRDSTYASRAMKWSGLFLLAFLVYHLLDLTTGTVHAGFVPGDVYGNLTGSFKIAWVAGLYIVGNLCLGLHLFHGAWSFMQTLGWNHPRYNAMRNRLALGFAALVVIGNLSFPLAVLSGVVR